MGPARLTDAPDQSPLAPCSRCQATGCPWDRLGPVAVCPDCQEALVVGEAAPLALPLEGRPCAACARRGVVPLLTYPLRAAGPLALDLCPRHLYALVGRRLDRAAYRVLARRLAELGLSHRQVFLLHEAFYDERGHPLQPVRA